MKLKIFILFIFLLNNAVLCQNIGEVIYTASVDTIGMNNKSKKTKRALKMMQKVIENSNNSRLKLTYTKNISFCELLEKSMNNDATSENIYNLGKIMLKIGSKFYNDIKDNYILEEREFFGELFLIKKSKNISDWKLLNIKEKIGKYTCFKAERNYVYASRKGKATQKQSLWYCPEIPVPFGPKEFVGFPGLVLKVQAGKITYTAEKIILNYSKETTIKKPTKGKKITEKELYILGKKAMREFTRN